MKKLMSNIFNINNSKYYGEPGFHSENCGQDVTGSQSVALYDIELNNSSSKHFDLYNKNINTYDIPLIS